jgi:RNA polymerase sigma factor (sigma-70 family)
MDGATEFESLMGRVRAGCPRAAQEVFDRYSDAVRRVVRRALRQRMRARYDSHDFLQSVWASFFLTPPEQYTFDTPEALVRFLSRVAFHKVVDEGRRQLGTDKHDVNRERSLEAVAGPYRRPEEVLAGRTPTPSQVLMAEERWQQLLKGQPPQARRVLELLRQGYSHQEIADQLGLYPKLIQRFLQKLRQRGEPQ